MPADPMLSSELKSLHEEISTVRRDRPPAARRAAGGGAEAGPESAAAGAPSDSEIRYLQEQLRELVDEVRNFFEEGEKNISAHPTESVLGAMLVGILIGVLLGRR